MGEPRAAIAPPPVVCPDCGAPMVLRTARTGARAGQQFYGCSTYPRCRTIVNLGRDGQPQAADVAAGHSKGVPTRAVRTQWAEQVQRGNWTGFYAPAGGRLRAWDPLARLDDRDAWIRASSQAAFYLAGDAQEISDQLGVVVDTARRLLTRGDRPPADPDIEDWILRASDLDDATSGPRDRGDVSRVLNATASLPSSTDVRATLVHREAFRLDPAAQRSQGAGAFESLGEMRRFEDVLDAAGHEVGHWAQFQPQFSGLLLDPREFRRADLLLSMPASSPVVLEVDGCQHASSIEADRDRDQALQALGINVIRVPSTGSDLAVAEVRNSLPLMADGSVDARSRLLVWGATCANRVARAMVESIGAGFLSGLEWHIRIHEPLGIGQAAIASFAEAFAALCDVWSVAAAPERIGIVTDAGKTWLRRFGTCHYEPNDDSGSASERTDVTIHVDLFEGPWHELPGADRPAVVVRSLYLPVPLREGRLEGGVARHVPDPDGIDGASLSRLLTYIFAKREFYPLEEGPGRRGQEISIRRLLGGRDTVVLLPTGAGKSLIYQFAGLMLPGRTLVIDPIIALIDDQLAGLAAQGIDRAVGITSADRVTGDAETKLAEVQAGDALFCFVAPERLQQRSFRNAIRALTAATPINVCVVDEAHCVSEWGHDFRTSYLDLGRVLREVCADTLGAAPPILALTGTASRAVLRDMLIELDIDRSDPEAIVSPRTFDREELRFSVVRSNEDEIVPRLLGALRSLPGQFRLSEREFFQPRGRESYCGIVFSQTVNATRSMPAGGVVNLAAAVANELGAQVGLYSGSKPKKWYGEMSWDQQKRADARAFKENQKTVLVATKAYGMGIDKPNIRYTVHLGVPGSIEAYYQEAGRAGRDRLRAQCVIVHSPADRDFYDFTHSKSYRGVDRDVETVERMLGVLGDLGERTTVNIPRSRDDDAAEDEERAIHRLKILGVVTDYLVDWGSSTFEVKLAPVTAALVDERLLAYVRRTQPGRVPAFERELRDDPPITATSRVLANAGRLVAFIYETVVRSRQRALDEMIALAQTATDDQSIRDRILRYLELGRIAGELETLVDEEPFSFSSWQELYLQIDTVDDAREWRGATARYLESSPDHPGLLVGRALAEAVVPGGDMDTFAANLAQAIASAGERYAVEPDSLASFLEWQLNWLHERRPQWAGLGYVIAERAIGEESLGLFGSLERRTVADTDNSIGSELGVVLARRLDRAIHQLDDLVAAVEELSS